MISLINIASWLALSLFLSPPINEFSSIHEPDQDRYCNDQFGFCSEYPGSTLTIQEDFNDGDGILLRTGDRAGEVIIAGFKEMEGLSAREVFQSSVRELKQPGEKDFIISSIFGEDFYESYFIINKKSYYQKAFLFNGYFVRLAINVPINRPDLLPILKQQITLDFEGLSDAKKPSAELAGQH